MLDIIANYTPVIVPIIHCIGCGWSEILGYIIGYGIGYGAIFVWLGLYCARPFSKGGKWDWTTGNKLMVILGSVSVIAGSIYSIDLIMKIYT